MNGPSVKSYRYLRIGMVGAVGLLAASIGLERLGVDCWQTSISGYYYTPVRAIFVGALMAIGLSLVVVKGRTEVEDALLNVAGMLAPVVAVVPTTEVVSCWSVPPAQFPVDTDDFAMVFQAAIRNNMGALLATAVVGLVVAAVLGQRTMGSARAAVRELGPGSRWGLGVAAVLVVVTTAALLWWPGFPTHAHDIAAIGMFACLAAAVWFNGREGARARESTYPTAYRAIALVMVAPAVVLPFFNGFDHWVFVVEAVEIAAFATFWILQTRQFWTRGEPESDPLPHFQHPRPGGCVRRGPLPLAVQCRGDLTQRGEAERRPHPDRGPGPRQEPTVISSGHALVARARHRNSIGCHTPSVLFGHKLDPRPHPRHRGRHRAGAVRGRRPRLVR